MAKRWIVSPTVPEVEALAANWRVPPLVAQLLFNRGHQPGQAAEDFLAPQLNKLADPSAIPGMTKAVELIVDAIRAKSKIVLYGDYDVDGITGVAILWHVLTLPEAEVSFYVPHRIDEGYGLNREAARQIIESGAKLVVTVDCGISAADEAAVFRDAGVRLVITDHHTPPPQLPQADSIVHPALEGDPGPHLCGAAVAFKLGWGIAQRLCGSERVSPAYRSLLVELLPLAGLGTIADIVPLVGENRIIASHGLAGIADTSIPGLRALMDFAGLSDAPVSDFDAGFKLAPRLNAAGRMGHARLAVELLTRADTQRANEIGLYLEEHNRSRQATERRILRTATERIEAQNLAGDARRAIVVAGAGWHPGVIGIVAARIVEKYHRPAVLIAVDGDVGQASCRSIAPFNISEALAACSEWLETFGGHAMAAGFRIQARQIEAFDKAFVEIANNRLTPSDMMPKLRLDAEVELDELDLPTVEVMARLGPFGAGNPRPRFASGWVELADEPRRVGARQDHLRVLFRQNGVRVRAIGFGLSSALEDLKHHRRCRVAFAPIINDFNGRRSVEMQMLDFEFPRA